MKHLHNKSSIEARDWTFGRKSWEVLLVGAIEWNFIKYSSRVEASFYRHINDLIRDREKLQ